MTKSMLLDISLLVELLKGIEFTFIRKDAEIVEARVHMLQQLSSACVDVLRPVRAKLESTRKLDSNRLDTLTVLSILQTALMSSESLSYCRQAVVQLTSAMVSASSQFAEADSARLRSYVRRMVTLGSMSSMVYEACNTEFLYYHRDSLLPIAVANFFQIPSSLGTHKLQYLVAAFADGVRACAVASHSEPGAFIAQYREFMLLQLRKEIVEPLCRYADNVELCEVCMSYSL